jgi:hypothetical protein
VSDFTVLPTVLECQTCGAKIADLSPAQAQRVAANPYNYLLDCVRCILDREKS